MATARQPQESATLGTPASDAIEPKRGRQKRGSGQRDEFPSASRPMAFSMLINQTRFRGSDAALMFLNQDIKLCEIDHRSNHFEIPFRVDPMASAVPKGSTSAGS